MKSKTLFSLLLALLLFQSFSCEQPIASTPQQKEVFLLAASNGETDNAVGDYSQGGAVFTIQPPAGEDWSIARVLIGMEARGELDSGGYGDGRALKNGVMMSYTMNGKQVDLFPFRVRRNAQYGLICFDVKDLQFGAGIDNNSVLPARYSFFRSGQPIILKSETGDRIDVHLEDDLRGLVEHRFLFHGYKL